MRTERASSACEQSTRQLAHFRTGGFVSQSLILKEVSDEKLLGGYFSGIAHSG